MILREIASFVVVVGFIVGILGGFEIGQENPDKQSILQIFEKEDSSSEE